MTNPTEESRNFEALGRQLNPVYLDIFTEVANDALAGQDAEVEVRKTAGIQYANGLELAQAKSNGHIDEDVTDTNGVVSELISKGFIVERLAKQEVGLYLASITLKQSDEPGYVRIGGRLEDVRSDLYSGFLINGEKRSTQKHLHIERFPSGRTPTASNPPRHNVNFGRIRIPEGQQVDPGTTSKIRRGMPRRIRFEPMGKIPHKV